MLLPVICFNFMLKLLKLPHIVPKEIYPTYVNLYYITSFTF